jgi:hypothetical protein
MAGFEPRFDRDLERGEVGEALLDLLVADSNDPNITIEVKTDYRANETGNFYVETHKYRKSDASDAVPSGIYGTHSKWWGQASPDGTAILLIKTEAMRNYIEFVDPPKSAQPIANAHSAASLGVLVSIKGLMKFLKMWKASE